MKDHAAPARTLIDRGVPVAIGTDFKANISLWDFTLSPEAQKYLSAQRTGGQTGG